MDGSSKYYPEWGNAITKEHIWYSFTDKWILAQKLRIPRYNSQTWSSRRRMTKSMDTLVLLRRGNKIPMEGVTEIKCETETKIKAIQRLPHLGIHPIYSHQIQTLLWMPTSACWQKPDIAVFWNAVPVPEKYLCGRRYFSGNHWRCSANHWTEHRVPNGGAREKTQGAEGVCRPIGGTIWTEQYP